MGKAPLILMAILVKGMGVRIKVDSGRLLGGFVNVGAISCDRKQGRIPTSSDAGAVGSARAYAQWQRGTSHSDPGRAEGS